MFFYIPMTTREEQERTLEGSVCGDGGGGEGKRKDVSLILREAKTFM